MHNTMKKEKEAEKEASARKMNTINEDSKSGSSDSENEIREDPPRMTSVASSGHYRKRKEQKSASKLEKQDSLFGNTGTYSMSNTTSPKDAGSG